MIISFFNLFMYRKKGEKSSNIVLPHFNAKNRGKITEFFSLFIKKGKGSRFLFPVLMLKIGKKTNL